MLLEAGLFYIACSKFIIVVDRVKMGDFRVEWVKGKALKFMEETNGQLFDDMLAEDGGHLWNKMTSFLNDDVLGSQDVSRRLFFLYKTYYEKLVHEELVAPKDGENCEIYSKIYFALKQAIRNVQENLEGFILIGKY